MNARYGSALKILIVWAALELARIASRCAFPVVDFSSRQYTLWAAAVDLLTLTTLLFLAMRGDWKGWRLGFAVAVIPFTIDLINFIEGTLFLGGLDFRSMYQTTLSYASLIPIMAFLFTKSNKSIQASKPFRYGSLGKKISIFIVCDFAYVFLYIIAGLIIFPFVRGFYAAHPLPSPGKIILLQLLLRGPVFTAICLLLIYMSGPPRRSKIFMVGIAFAILSGGVLLLLNPHLPDHVRWIHCAEVGSSGFLFGLLVASLWGASGRRANVLTQTA